MLSQSIVCRAEESEEFCWFAVGIRSKNLMNKTLAALTTLLGVVSAMCYIDLNIRNVIKFVTQIPRSAYDVCTK